MGACEDTPLPALDTELVVGGLDAPVYVTQLPGTNDLLVVEQGGVIERVHEGALADTPFFEIDVDFDMKERGLFSIAFHPDYMNNGRFFVAFTPDATHNRVSEFHVSADPLVADSDDEVARLVDVDDPDWNHNGGMLAFGPDGYLYVSMGDGGGGGDNHGELGNGQNLDSLLGKILRLDVENAAGEYIADGHPFDAPEGRPEIWMYGLRNPWRFSFDRLNGDVYIGDAGQEKVEEVDYVPAGTGAGANFGWRGYEGDEVYDQEVADMITDHHGPIVQVHHPDDPLAGDEIIENAACMIGGYVYRGAAIDGLFGYYVFGDCQGTGVAAFRVCDGERQDLQAVPGLSSQGFGLTSFGEDAVGELYMVFAGTGELRRVIAAN
jgi:glucose/arabinose dehydrogenase